MKMTRRRFIEAAAGAGFLLLRDPRSARTYAANETLGVALVGAGGRGTHFAETMPALERITAVCDVDDHRAETGLRHLPEDIPYYHDFRVMLDERRDEIEAVVVSTPDHTHAVTSAAAMQAGKHVLCEKPLTNTVREARTLRDLAREHGVATQMGNQGGASAAFREAVEILRGGHIGRIREVHIWNESAGPAVDEPPKHDDEAPGHLQWDLWLGPAASRPFLSPWLLWHRWRDFGTGQLGNWGTHTANLPFMALNIDTLWEEQEPEPIRVEAKVEAVNRLSFPRWEIVEWHVPARPDWPPITITWHNGPAPDSRALLEDLMGRRLDWGDAGDEEWADWAGVLIVGAEGKLYANEHNTSYSLMPEDQFRDFAPPEPTLSSSPGHEREWLEACRGGPPAISSFDYASPLTEFLLLGNVATQFPGALEYDPRACHIINCAEANEALHRDYRDGWAL